MFVTMKKTAAVSIFAALTMTSGMAQASEVGTLTVNLKGVQAGGGPLYVSVQNREEFMQDQGTSGGIYTNVTGGDVDYQYSLIPAGDYSVMIWHDTDNDGEFTMDERYMPLDGWGASGPLPQGVPAFDDVKITIGKSGTMVTIDMQYPR